MGYEGQAESEVDKVVSIVERPGSKNRTAKLPFESLNELRVRASQMADSEVVCGPLQTGTWGIILNAARYRDWLLDSEE